MFERECRLYANMLHYGKLLTADLNDGQLLLQPLPGINTPMWVLGHLAVVSDQGLEVLGQPKVCPEAWHQAFTTGTKPDAGPQPQPSKAELLAALERGHDLLTRAARNASPAALDSPNPVPFLRTPYPTVADLLAHLMTTHEGIHLGQLSAWRRLMGLPPVLEG